MLIGSKSSHCNVDGDVVVYAAGFASQSNEYWVDKDVFDTKKEAQHFCVRYGIDQEEVEVGLTVLQAGLLLMLIEQEVGRDLLML